MTNTFYSVRITETTANLFSSTYRFSNQESFNFKDLKSAIDFIKERYESRRREKMYIDGKDGEAIHVGWVYKYRNADLSHYPAEHWNQCDWVEVMEIKETRVIF